MREKGYLSIDEYIGSFPEETQRKLQKLRLLIREVAPEAQERIAYEMPTFYLNGNLVHFAAHTRHIGFYPTPSGILKFRKELARYETSKGAVQFPTDEPLPLGLIKRIVQFRVRESRNKTKK